MRDLLYLELITYAFIISGYVVSILFPKDTVAGMSCVTIGLFTLIILKSVSLTRVPEISIGLLIPVIPAVIILAISIWILSININYSKKIKEGALTKEYKTFNSISFVLLLIQLVLLYKNNIPYSFSIMSLLASFQMITVFIMQMNLEYFITDG